MSDQISFLLVASNDWVFSEEAAASMVGQETRLDGAPVRIVAAELADSGAIRVTVEGVVPEETLKAIRGGTEYGLSYEPDTEGA